MLKPSRLREAANLLIQGECVGFPTETVYGLGANALDTQAVEKIFAAKGRPQDNPLIVHIHHLKQLDHLVASYSPEARILMDTFWPGPLTLVLPKTDQVPTVTTGGLDTVAVRMPDHKLALELLSLTNLPVAAPSANLSGKPSPTTAQHVWEDLQGRIPAIVDGGPTGWGVESTVVDCTVTPCRLLRPGGITREEIEKHIPIVVDPGVFQTEVENPRSPGMKYRHYSPEAKVIVVVGERIHSKIQELIAQYTSSGSKVGVMAFQDSDFDYPDVSILSMGPRNKLREAASKIYGLLRQADQLGLDIVLVEGFLETDLGMAVMNRLKKAAGYYVINS